MNVSKFRDGSVHFRNSGVKGLRPIFWITMVPRFITLPMVVIVRFTAHVLKYCLLYYNTGKSLLHGRFNEDQLDKSGAFLMSTTPCREIRKCQYFLTAKKYFIWSYELERCRIEKKIKYPGIPVWTHSHSPVRPIFAIISDIEFLCSNDGCAGDSRYRTIHISKRLHTFAVRVI